MNLTDNFPQLLSRLQSAQSLGDISFVSAYSKEQVSRPVESPICSVGSSETEIYTDIYSNQTFELKVYSPLSQGGRGCYDYVNRIAEYLLSSFRGIVRVTSYNVDYNINTACFCATLKVRFRTDLFSSEIESSNPTPITINSSIFNAGNCVIYEKKDIYQIRELWKRYPIDYIDGSSVYIIRIGKIDLQAFSPLANLTDFSLNFESVLYTGCNFTDIEYDVANGIVETAEIYAKGRSVIYG